AAAAFASAKDSPPLIAIPSVEIKRRSLDNPNPQPAAPRPKNATILHSRLRRYETRHARPAARPPTSHSLRGHTGSFLSAPLAARASSGRNGRRRGCHRTPFLREARSFRVVAAMRSVRRELRQTRRRWPRRPCPLPRHLRLFHLSRVLSLARC